MTENTKKYIILVTPFPAVGHVNSVAGALKPLLRRGHRIIFILEDAFAGKVAPYGFEEHLMSFKKPEDSQKPGEIYAKRLIEGKVLGNYSPEEKMARMSSMFDETQYRDDNLVFEPTVKKAIEQYKPDLIYIDHFNLLPSIYYSGIPWIKHISTTPLFYILDDNVIPSGSGYSSDTETEKIKEFNKLRQPIFYSNWYNEFVQSFGYESFPSDLMMPETQKLVVYGYPDELNYPYVRNLDWFNLEAFVKVPMTSQLTLQDYVPKEFIENNLNGNFSGKYIYISMGSMGSIDLDLMKRLVSVLGRTNHKYIVSKGPRHNEFELANNMYGDRFLPQTKLLPLVDLVITHGGNNTFTETFSVGKPMIIMPLFTDQFDNAQRIKETGLGARLHPYEYKDEELIETIDKLLNDEQLHSRLISAAKRIHSIDKHEELADKIEHLLSNK